jgi:RNA polymerase sigma factor (TIGR02999 family)
MGDYFDLIARMEFSEGNSRSMLYNAKRKMDRSASTDNPILQGKLAMAGPPKNVTALLSAVSSGDEESWKKLFSVVYQELHHLAHSAMRKEHAGHTLQTTALVHEAYMRLVDCQDLEWQDRSHFFRVAARGMRRILVDSVRRRNAAKRGGPGKVRADREVAELSAPGPTSSDDPFEDLEVLDRALEKFALDEKNKRKCTIVELHFFAGFTFDETAEILGVSPGTVYRDWEFTRVWLRREMKKSSGPGT